MIRFSVPAYDIVNLALGAGPSRPSAMLALSRSGLTRSAACHPTDPSGLSLSNGRIAAKPEAADLKLVFRSAPLAAVPEDGLTSRTRQSNFCSGCQPPF